MTSKTTPTTPTPPGIWVGIDLGTSNCACAVWDSTRGGSKWIRLPGIAPLEASGKLGRIVPSVICLHSGYNNHTLLDDNHNNHNDDAYDVGAQALDATTTTTTTLIQSVKRLLGKKWKELDPDFCKSLPLELVPDNDKGDDFKIRVVVETGTNNNNNNNNTNNDIILVTPVECAAMLLHSIRIAADAYLHKFTKKKYLDIPGGSGRVQHVVIGIPAHFSVAQQKLVEQAAKMAGFATASTLMESTAAAMAYGLSFTNNNHNHTDDGSTTQQTIMVVDMGGGTTDVTIATRSEEAYQVVVTEGDARLGGDDMDQAILEFVLEKQATSEPQGQPLTLSISQRRHLLSSCKAAKEALCDPETKSDDSRVITYLQDNNNKTQVTMTQDDLEQILAPWIARAKTLVQTALDRLLLPNNNTNNNNTVSVTEVVLVGGTTRVPAIRNMLQTLFPTIELCTSLHPMASVAQGLAIHAALKSKLVPKHESQSALMLDSTPHAIGVDVGGGVFCEVIPRNTRLPAMGSATFTLATKTQPGVSIAAVERIDENNTNNNNNNNNASQTTVTLEKLGDFTFLLRRLPPNELETLPDDIRTIQVGMQVDPDGKFIVSIFDEKDPEQVRKKERWQQLQRDTKNNSQEAAVLGYIANLVMAESGESSEQSLLVAACLGLFVIYIGVKIAFAEMPQEESAPIL